jgi:hypothetical protein
VLRLQSTEEGTLPQGRHHLLLLSLVESQGSHRSSFAIVF